MNSTRTVCFRVYGIVQGVGFRPTVDRHARAAGIRGSVCNKGPYVEIIAQGSPDQIGLFGRLLKDRPPRRAAILKIDEKPLADARPYDCFSIIESEKTSGEIYISPDIAICEDCERELYDPTDRRYLHPFINCTCCGPRMTILDALPYDRERTSMKMFPMCRPCAEEYHGSWSRRYDAQPVCCNDCGPEVYLLQTGAPEDSSDTGSSEMSRKVTRGGVHADVIGREAITAARRTILEGGIVAVKGIGGFHLCCDATNEAAVEKLRTRKRRPAKPFAVMMRDEKTVRRECVFDEEQGQILTGHQKPILLLDKKRPAERAQTQAPMLAQAVAPGNPKVGVMLPYAPLQHLLFTYDDGLTMPDCLVMTSGNVSGAPICRDDTDARAELSAFCDCILSHDRLIRIRADDSVMDFHRGRPYMIRRSRGYAPLPVLLTTPQPGAGKLRPTETQAGEAQNRTTEIRPGLAADTGGSPEMKGCVLAVGGELKNSFCIGSGNLLYLSPYVGDLEDLRTVRALQETIHRMETLLEVTPQAVVCDLHPKYNATMVAEEIAAQRKIPLVRIQHHYAHVLSCMAENDRSDPVIGVSFDGTGFGEDGTIWGGEIMTADYQGYRRRFSIAPFLQIGGDSAPRQGWRIAASMIWSLCKKGFARQPLQKQKDYCGGPGLQPDIRGEAGLQPDTRGESGLHENSGGGSGRIDPAETYFSILESLSICDLQNAKAQRMMAERGIQAVTSTSAGRLFDAVSAMLGICRTSTYEGEASIELEFAAERYAAAIGAGPADQADPLAGNLHTSGIHAGDLHTAGIHAGNLQAAGLREADSRAGNLREADPRAEAARMKEALAIPEAGPHLPTDRLFSMLLQKRLRGEDPEKLAWLFHVLLADLVVEACARVSRETGIRTAALTGGCYQNRLLLTLTEDGLVEKGLEVLIHHLVPPNDGGIALGQAAAAMVRMQRTE